MAHWKEHCKDCLDAGLSRDWDVVHKWLDEYAKILNEKPSWAWVMMVGYPKSAMPPNNNGERDDDGYAFRLGFYIVKKRGKTYLSRSKTLVGL